MEGTQTTPASGPSREARNWAILAHLGPIALALVSLGVLGWMVPLAVWLTHKTDDPFVAGHALASLNFRILLLILYILALPLIFLFFCFGIPLWGAIWIFELIAGIVAAVRASDGLPYRYPITPRFLG
jgi:uncharacterized Tic20 family protein